MPRVLSSRMVRKLSSNSFLFYLSSSNSPKVRFFADFRAVFVKKWHFFRKFMLKNTFFSEKVWQSMNFYLHLPPTNY